jgi:hypothetical protein
MAAIFSEASERQSEKKGTFFEEPIGSARRQR